MKEDREKFWKKNQRLKQETGIVNKKSLKVDYDKRKEENIEMDWKCDELEKYHNRMYEDIKRAH
jgi:hypothetical protein